MIEEQGYPRDTRRIFESTFKNYEWVFGIFKERFELDPKKILVAGCGFGADVLALGRTFPDPEIVAVSVGQYPLHAVEMELKPRLSFHHEDILDYLERESTNDPGFDLVVFANVAPFSFSNFYKKPELYAGMYDVTRPGGVVIGCSQTMFDFQEMRRLFKLEYCSRYSDELIMADVNVWRRETS